MRVSHLSVCVCVGKLYAVGGYDGSSRQCLSTVEEYDPVTDQWCYVADMSTRRSGAGARTHTKHCYFLNIFAVSYNNNGLMSG